MHLNEFYNDNWADEFYALYYSGAEKVFSLCKNGDIKHRFTVLTSGLFIAPDKDVQSEVNDLLRHNGFDILNVRISSDAFFIYSYKKARNIPTDRRLDVFLKDMKAYLDWKSGKAAAKKHITTFGDLYNVLYLNSQQTRNNTLITRSRSKYLADELLNTLADEDDGLTKFLGGLEANQEIAAYNNISTYYAQKILYDMFKSAIDLLCRHNLPEDTNLRKKYLDARSIALKNNDCFNRYLDMNKLLLDDIKGDEFRTWICNNEPISDKACMKYLMNKKISYSRIFTHMYDFFTLCSFSLAVSYFERKGNPFKSIGIPEDVYTDLFGEGANCRERIINSIIGFTDGSFYANRTYLIMLSFYAGNDKDRINYILAACGFNTLDNHRPLDNEIICALDQGFSKIIRDMVNEVNFINRIHPTHYSEADRDENVGFDERKKYYETLESFQKRFVSALCELDHEQLTEIFRKDKIHKAEAQNDKELKKIRKNRK